MTYEGRRRLISAPTRNIDSKKLASTRSCGRVPRRSPRQESSNRHQIFFEDLDFLRSCVFGAREKRKTLSSTLLALGVLKGQSLRKVLSGKVLDCSNYSSATEALTARSLSPHINSHDKLPFLGFMSRRWPLLISRSHSILLVAQE